MSVKRRVRHTKNSIDEYLENFLPFDVIDKFIEQSPWNVKVLNEQVAWYTHSGFRHVRAHDDSRTVAFNKAISDHGKTMNGLILLQGYTRGEQDLLRMNIPVKQTAAISCTCDTQIARIFGSSRKERKSGTCTFTIAIHRFMDTKGIYVHSGMGKVLFPEFEFILPKGLWVTLRRREVRRCGSETYVILHCDVSTNGGPRDLCANEGQ